MSIQGVREVGIRVLSLSGCRVPGFEGCGLCEFPSSLLADGLSLARLSGHCRRQGSVRSCRHLGLLKVQSWGGLVVGL